MKRLQRPHVAGCLQTLVQILLFHLLHMLSTRKKKFLDRGNKKKNPAVMPCMDSSFELTGNRWNRPDGFRLPVKACRLLSTAKVPCWWAYGSRTLLPNHEHGRVNSFTNPFSKELHAVRDISLRVRPTCTISKSGPLLKLKLRRWRNSPPANLSQEELTRCGQALAPLLGGSGAGRIMESALSFFRMHWDRELRTSETAPPRCRQHSSWAPAAGYEI